MSDQDKHAGGRPPKYDPKTHPVAVEYMATAGLTDKEMAEKLDISLSTFYEWSNKHSEFSDAKTRGKEKPDDMVENALLQSALGYEHDSVHITNHQGVVTKTPIKKKYPPNDRSIQFWLKNRRPEKWRDKQEIDLTGSVNLVMDSDDENL